MAGQEQGTLNAAGQWFRELPLGLRWLGEVAVLAVGGYVIWAMTVWHNAASRDDLSKLSDGIHKIDKGLIEVKGKLETGLAEVNGRLKNVEAATVRMEKDIDGLKQYHMNGATEKTKTL